MSLIFWSQNHLRRASEKFSSDIYLYTKIWSSNIRRYLRENADTRKTFFFQIRLSNNRNFFELFLPPHHSVLTHDMCVQMLECSIRSGIVQSFYDSSFQSHSWLKSVSNLINHLLYWAEKMVGLQKHELQIFLVLRGRICVTPLLQTILVVSDLCRLHITFM